MYSNVKYLLISLLLMFSPLVVAEDEKPFAEARLILQLGDGDEQSQAMVLNVANNLIKEYGGPEFIDIEVVAYGPGIKLLYASNPNVDRISSLLANDVRFVACQNTLDTIERKTGKRPDIIKSAIPVQTGVARIIKRAQEGFVIVRP